MNISLYHPSSYQIKVSYEPLTSDITQNSSSFHRTVTVWYSRKKMVVVRQFPYSYHLTVLDPSEYIARLLSLLGTWLFFEIWYLLFCQEPNPTHLHWPEWWRGLDVGLHPAHLHHANRHCLDRVWDVLTQEWGPPADEEHGRLLCGGSHVLGLWLGLLHGRWTIFNTFLWLNLTPLCLIFNIWNCLRLGRLFLWAWLVRWSICREGTDILLSTVIVSSIHINCVRSYGGEMQL